jgi:hypothetical protein
MSSAKHIDDMRAFVDGLREREGTAFEAAASRVVPGGVDPAAAALESAAGIEEGAGLEAIVATYRPVFAVADDKVDPTLSQGMVDPRATAAADLVKQRAATINAVIPAVGRIDLVNNDQYPWVGTGWVIDTELGDDIILTNAHVAEHFAERFGQGFVFSAGTFDPQHKQSASIDFRHEISATQPRVFRVTEVIYIGTPGLLDAALLRVQRTAGADRLSGPIRLAKDDPAANVDVATIGYPGNDRASYDVATLLRVFGNIFDTKRFSPGKVVGMQPRGLAHDCSTMPGSSGSTLINMATGEAVGLHFRGEPFKVNHALPASAIGRLIKERPWQTSSRPAPTRDEALDGGLQAAPVSTSAGSASAPVQTDTARITTTVDANGVRIMIPLEITVRLGGAEQQQTPSTTPYSQPREKGTPEAAAALVRDRLRTRSEIVDIRPTYLFADGLLTDQRGVVVRVRPDAPRDPAGYGLDSTIAGVPVVIEVADLESLARNIGALGEEAPAQMQNYRRDLSDPRFNLDPVSGNMSLTLHISPEAGWRKLSAFFESTGYDQITIGMYHFTAPHVIDAVRDAVKSPSRTRLTMTIDRKKGDDIGTGKKINDWPETKVLDALEGDAGNRFKWTPASISGPGKLFHSAYHIKVAVLSKRAGSGAQASLTDKAFWLSSGNWQSSNQAPFTDESNPIAGLTWNDVKDYDRDWHAIVESEQLARTFRNHLQQDFADNEALAGPEAAIAALPDLLVPDDLFVEAPRRPRLFRAFEPKTISGQLTVQPVLTPDNYPDVVVPLIEGARESVLFINQSFDMKTDPADMPEHFLKLARALLNRQKQGLDVRIIFRSGFGKEGETLRRAVEFGFDKERIKFFDKCHTKGIVVDHQRVLLGSQNWTGAGTRPNRDASLLIDNEGAAKYFAEIFEFDWEQVATNRVAGSGGSGRPVRSVESDNREAPVPAGYRRISWQDWMEA